MAINTSRKRRMILSALGAVTAVGLLAGCGSSTPGQGAGEGDGGSGGATTVQFWHRTFTPVENAWYKDIVKKFNASQDKIKVVDTEVPADAWDQKMKAAQAAGKAPDIYTHSGSIQDAVNAGQLYELNKVVDQSKLDEIIDAAKPVSEIGGKYYAYPLLLEAQTVLFWNKEMLTKAGVDPEAGPTTWDELLADCAKIQPTLAKGTYCISPASDAVTFAWSTVGQQYNFSGHTALTDDWTKPDINNDGYKSLMLKYKELWDKGYMAKQALDAYVGGKDFGEKKVAFKVSGSWMMSQIGSDYKDMLTNTGVGAFPNASGADGRTALMTLTPSEIQTRLCEYVRTTYPDLDIRTPEDQEARWWTGRILTAIGFLFAPMTIVERLVAFFGALCLLGEFPYSDWVGFGLGIASVVWQWRQRARALAVAA